MSRPAVKTTADLTDREQLLVMLMSELNFGRIERIPIRDGQPCLDKAVAVRNVKLGAEEGSHQAGPSDFRLKDCVVELVGQLRRVQSGTIRKIEVRHGLPAHLQLEQSAHGLGGSR